MPVSGTETEQCSIRLQKPAPVKIGCQTVWHMLQNLASNLWHWFLARFLERVSGALGQCLTNLHSWELVAIITATTRQLKAFLASAYSCRWRASCFWVFHLATNCPSIRLSIVFWLLSVHSLTPVLRDTLSRYLIPSSPCPFTSSSFPPFYFFSFFHWLYLFSSFVHPFPFYQNSPTLFPGRRS